MYIYRIYTCTHLYMYVCKFIYVYIEDFGLRMGEQTGSVYSFGVGVLCMCVCVYNNTYVGRRSSHEGVACG